jgi:integrase
MSKLRAVGRTRTQTTLPKYVILYHGSHYYRGPASAWKRINLGRDFAEAMTRYGALYREVGMSTWGDVFDKYEQMVVPTKAAATQASNRFELKALRGALAHMRPTDLTPVHVYAVRDAIMAKLGVVQANLHLALLKHLCVKAIEWGAITAHPARDVKKIPVPARTRLPSREEFDRVYAHALPMLRCAMDLAELTTMDRGAILAIERKHCQDDGLHWWRPKTKRRAPREIIVEWSDELRAVVDRAKKLKPEFRSHLIATTRAGRGEGARAGRPLTPSGFSTMWQRAMVKAEDSAKAEGVEFERFHFHDIRALSITETEDLVEASERAGHSSTEITKRVYRRKASKVKSLR